MKCPKCKQCEMLITGAENILKQGAQSTKLYRVLNMACPKCKETLTIEHEQPLTVQQVSD